MPQNQFQQNQTTRVNQSEQGFQFNSFNPRLPWERHNPLNNLPFFNPTQEGNDFENNTFLIGTRKICGFDYDSKTGMTERDKDSYYDLLFKEDADKLLSFDWLEAVCKSIMLKGSKTQKEKASKIKKILDMGESNNRNKMLYPEFDKFCFRKGFTVKFGKRKEFAGSGTFVIVPIIVNKKKTDCCERRHLLCSKTSKKSITKKIVKRLYGTGSKPINLIGATKKTSPTNKRIAPTPFKVRGCLLYNKSFANRFCVLGLRESGWVALTVSSIDVNLRSYALYDRNPAAPAGKTKSFSKYPANSPIWNENFWAFNQATKSKCFSG